MTVNNLYCADEVRKVGCFIHMDEYNKKNSYDSLKEQYAMNLLT